jgi:hypothetical protein
VFEILNGLQGQTSAEEKTKESVCFLYMLLLDVQVLKKIADQ